MIGFTGWTVGTNYECHKAPYPIRVAPADDAAGSSLYVDGGTTAPLLPQRYREPLSYEAVMECVKTAIAKTIWENQ